MNKKISKQLMSAAFKLEQQDKIWQQPIKIELKPEGAGLWRAYVQNAYNKYVMHAELIDEDEYNKKIQPKIEALIEALKGIVENE